MIFRLLQLFNLTNAKVVLQLITFVVMGLSIFNNNQNVELLKNQITNLNITNNNLKLELEAKSLELTKLINNINVIKEVTDKLNAKAQQLADDLDDVQIKANNYFYTDDQTNNLISNDLLMLLRQYIEDSRNTNGNQVPPTLPRIKPITK